MLRLSVFSLVACLVSIAALPAQKAPARTFDYETAAAYSEKQAGLAVLVYRDGKLVFERYQNGHTAKKTQHIFSGTKSFVPMVALVAQREGLLDLDERVADTLTEWSGDERREKITVRHLLNFTSGLEHIDNKLHSGRVKDTYEAAVACVGKTEPGSRFRYGSNHLTAFGAFFERKLAAAKPDGDEKMPKDFVAYLEDRILDPIGCEAGHWIRDRAGHPALPYGAFLTAREWGKFGQLVLQRGEWEDKQLIPEQSFDECFEGSKANPIYGLNFWLVGKRLRGVDGIPEDLVAAAGMYNQKLYVIPSEKLVIVRFGRTRARARFSDRGFLGPLFANADAPVAPAKTGSGER